MPCSDVVLFQYWTELVFRHPHITVVPCSSRAFWHRYVLVTRPKDGQKRFGKRDVKKVKPTRDINSAGCHGIEQSSKKRLLASLTPNQLYLDRVTLRIKIMIDNNMTLRLTLHQSTTQNSISNLIEGVKIAITLILCIIKHNLLYCGK
jgi:hypothetical protein